MVDDDRRRQRAEEVLQLRQVGGLEVDDDVPAERCDALRDRRELVGGCGVDQAPHEVEPHPPDPGLVELAQLGVTDIRSDGRDAAGPAVGRAHGVDHRPVVRAVARGLDDHVAAHAEVVAEGEELVLARVARRVLALGCEGERGAGPEHVAVRVDRARGEGERGNRGLRIPVQPPR